MLGSNWHIIPLISIDLSRRLSAWSNLTHLDFFNPGFQQNLKLFQWLSPILLSSSVSVILTWRKANFMIEYSTNRSLVMSVVKINLSYYRFSLHWCHLVTVSFCISCIYYVFTVHFATAGWQWTCLILNIPLQTKAKQSNKNAAKAIIGALPFTEEHVSFEF